MELSLTLTILISILFLIVAFLYASVGHGGASGYLAVLSLFAFQPKEMATTALLLNILVAGIAFSTYYRAGYFTLRLTMPFILSSIPMAFIGGMIDVSTTIYSILLAVALLFAAYRLTITIEQVKTNTTIASLNTSVALPVGGVIGLLSGIVGVGGGIFLSPLMLLMKWADPKQTSATSACFIVLNSIAGLLGRHFEQNFSSGNFLPFVLTAAIGGFFGSRYGTRRFSNLVLRRLLGIVLLIAVIKLLVSAL
ncbi:MAG: sulfite exporter TauE/SafE family protein [Ignavibacteriae bacterium]|nr:sulfite exporter TauE/SafE family protein [Ignavibacteriota bacterium]